MPPWKTMEFHGNPCDYAAMENHGIPWKWKPWKFHGGIITWIFHGFLKKISMEFFYKGIDGG